jgi:hypothetical protein
LGPLKNLAYTTTKIKGSKKNLEMIINYKKDQSEKGNIFNSCKKKKKLKGEKNVYSFQ